MAAPRLVTAWCWRQTGFPTFSASPEASQDADDEVHQELLLGFDVAEGCEHSMLSMTVHKQLAEPGPACVWSAALQVHSA